MKANIRVVVPPVVAKMLSREGMTKRSSTESPEMNNASAITNNTLDSSAMLCSSHGDFFGSEGCFLFFF